MFQTKEQKELMKFARVVCLDGTHGMNHHKYHLFTLIIKHPIVGSGYPVAFLISEFKRTSTLMEWFDFLKHENEEWRPDIFMVDDAGEEIRSSQDSFPDSSVFLCHFHVLRSWRRKLGHKRGTNNDLSKEKVWGDLWRLLKVEGWSDADARAEIANTINS
ncbi:6134_t:CDS:1 [Scutellospora calospora]|uniref:6134_t:CDS:1 n=1 Tax=Scutellospora calospora TaxID=85575 RepID=A0ACA9MCC3_9GLOM|nr:6134_t:CDS:1 [Scutellospora calospora]